MNHRILHASLFTPAPEGFWGMPIIQWGPPGVGKTQGVRAAAKRVNLPFERLSPAERGEGQFGVVPVPMDGFLRYPPPDWTERFKDGGIIAVDEATTAPPAIQAPLLGLVQFRTIGSYQFGPRTRVIAMANEAEDAAGGFDLASPLANRFGHFDYEGLSPNEWAIALLGGFQDAEDSAVVDARAEEERVMAAWPVAVAMARGMVAGFIKARPELLYKRPERGSRTNSRAWPSNRSCENAAHALAAARVHSLNEIDADAYMAGFVGQAWVQEFATWRANIDLPDPADLLDGKVTFKHEVRRLDRTVAVLNACAALVIPQKAEKRTERAKACWKVIGEVAKDAADVAVPAGTALRRAQLVGGEIAAAAKPVLAKLWTTMAEAGLRPTS